jgi:mannan endo-1,4-beta-mannosidase
MIGNSRFFRVVVGALAAAAVGSGASNGQVAVDHTRLTREGTMLLGVYYGNQGWTMTDVRALESWQGKGNAVVNVFTNWDSTPQVRDNLVRQQLPNVWDNHNVPMITWEPFTGQATPSDVDARVARGEYDSYVVAWARRLKLFLSGPDGVYGSRDDRRAYLRFAHEMNGNWYPWAPGSGGNTPADYVNMWRRVHGIFAAQGLDPTRLQWVWAVNAQDVGGYRAEEFFPGDPYVDWVGVDGYNWGTSDPKASWVSPSRVYDPMVSRLRAISRRPLSVSECATTSSTATASSVQAKSQWITDFYDYAGSRDVRMVAWFNTDKETDWAVFGGGLGDGTFGYGGKTYRTYAAYRTAVSQPRLTAADDKNPRLLTDQEFMTGLSTIPATTGGPTGAR